MKNENHGRDGKTKLEFNRRVTRSFTEKELFALACGGKLCNVKDVKLCVAGRTPGNGIF